MNNPVFLHWNADDGVRAECEGKPTSDITRRPTIYVDGELEYEIGYDCVEHVDGHIADVSEQLCTVVGEDGAEYDAKLLFTYSTRLDRYAGYIVKRNDEDAWTRLIEFAETV